MCIVRSIKKRFSYAYNNISMYALLLDLIVKIERIESDNKVYIEILPYAYEKRFLILIFHMFMITFLCMPCYLT